MKKIITLLLLLTYNVYSQSNPDPDIKIRSVSTYTNSWDENGCVKYYNLGFWSLDLLDSTRSFTWGDTYQEFRISVLDENDEVIFRQSYRANQYTGRIYRYGTYGPRMYSYLHTPTQSQKDLIAKAKASILKFNLEIVTYAFNNDPGLGIYFFSGASIVDSELLYSCKTIDYDRDNDGILTLQIIALIDTTPAKQIAMVMV